MKTGCPLRVDRIDWDKQPLGKMSDRALARLLGCSYRSVRYARTSRNIPVYQAPKKRTGLRH